MEADAHFAGHAIRIWVISLLSHVPINSNEADIHDFLFHIIDNIESEDDPYQYHPQFETREHGHGATKQDSFEMLLQSMTQTLVKRREMNKVVV